MKQLPKGVYAVYKPIKYGETAVTFRGETYEVIPGVNGFYCFEELVRSEMTKVEEPFFGYEDMAVAIVPAGTLPIGDWGKTNPDRFRTYFPISTAILGENVGVNPNEPDLRTPAARREESVIQGSIYFGCLTMQGQLDDGIIVDGVTLNCRMADYRTGGENAYMILKNSIINPAFGANVIFGTKDFVGKRMIALQDCRCVDMEAMNGEGSLLCLCSGEGMMERVYVANTEKFIGMTNYSRTQVNAIGGLTVKDSLFENCQSIHGLTVVLPEDSQAKITIENTEFLNVTPASDPVITLKLPEKASLLVKDCRFTGNHAVPAMELTGKNAQIENCTYEGFTGLAGEKKPRRTTVRQDAKYPITDAHEPVNADFAPLDALYAGKRCFHGDFHCHSNSGGTSDGQTPLAEYVPGMKKLDMDFAAIVDHRQMRHFFLPEWDEQYLICGTEPTCVLDEPDRPVYERKLDYTMIFPDKTGLAKVMERFPQFEYTGGTEGTYKYINHTRETLEEIGEYIYSIGGLMTHAHPKQLMSCKDPLRYYFGEHVALETIQGGATTLSTRKNRQLWMDLLQLGKRVKTHGSSDSHGPVSNRGLTTLYCHKHHSTDIFNTVRSGNCTAGAVGIQMSIDGAVMGSVTDYQEGKILYVKVRDFHRDHLEENTVYSLRLYTDQGLAWAKEFDGSNQQVAFPIKKRNFYRVEIYNESDDHVVALSNAIFLN